MKKYWLILNSESFLWIKRCEGIIYNTINSKYFTFKCIGQVQKICEKLLHIDNLYVVEINSHQLGDELVSGWVNRIISIESGLIIDQAERKEKPISFFPHVSIQHSAKNLTKDNTTDLARIINYVHEVNFYVNGSLFGNNSYFKQSLFPIYIKDQMSNDLLMSFISNCKNDYLFNINIVGNVIDFFNISLIDKIILIGIKVTLNVLIQDLSNGMDKLDMFKDFFSFNIIVEMAKINNNEKAYLKLTQKLNNAEMVIYKLVVQSEQELSDASIFIKKYNIKSYDFIPIYNGNNINFFKEEIFINESDFKRTKISKREIFAKQSFSIMSFGSISVFPNGNVYSNVNCEPIGTNCDLIYDLIFKELKEGSSWLNIRNQKPCCDCVFQWLCPSPSNYEYVIGKPNLCHIHK